jgi:hypothetical protein
MVHKSLESLRLDQRLRRRRGWLSAQERQRELEKLPDVSDKIGHSEDSPEGGEAGTQNEGQTP